MLHFKPRLYPLLLGLVLWSTTQAQTPSNLASNAAYAYGSSAFNQLIQDSSTAVNASGVRAFPEWFARAFQNTPSAALPGHAGLTLEVALKVRTSELKAQSNTAKRVQLERDTAAWLHKAVKASIPKFSLERGYEFVYTVKNGERQCLLQSVLISSLMQKMGLNAGIAMVWKNEKGSATNLSHVVTVLNLSDGHQIQVDASDPTPFAGHQGLFMWDAPAKGYRFLETVFGPQHTITAYKEMSGKTLDLKLVNLLPYNYVRSQFYYYRGERTPGGFADTHKTDAGQQNSIRFLEKAIEYAPENPLAQYVLGRVYARQGRAEVAKNQLEQGYKLYLGSGFVPQGPLEAYRALGH